MGRSAVVQEVKSSRLDIDLIRFVAAVRIVLGHCFFDVFRPGMSDLQFVLGGVCDIWIRRFRCGTLGITSFCVDIGMRIL